MRFTGIRLPLLAAVACASVGLSLSATDRSYGQAIYVYPTSSDDLSSTPYLLPRSYVVPSSYVFPSYIESSYTVEPAVSLLPTGYIETTYRRGLFGRRWIVERPVVAAMRRATFRRRTFRRPTSQPTCRRRMSARLTTRPRIESAGIVRQPTRTIPPRIIRPSTRPLTRLGRYLLLATRSLWIPVRSAPQGSAASSAPTGSSREVESRSLEDPTISVVRRRTAAGREHESTFDRAERRNEQGRREQRRQSSQSARCRRRRRGRRPKPRPKVRRTQKNAPAQKSGGAATPKTKAAAPTAPADDPDQIDLRPAPGSDEPVRRDSLKAIYPRVANCRPAERPLRLGRDRRRQTSRRSAGERRQS